MDKKVSGTIVASALPSPTNAGAAATPFIATEGLSIMGVTISDWVYIAVFVFYAISAIHIAYKIYVRHKWVKQNLDQPKSESVTAKRNSDDVFTKLIEAEKRRQDIEDL